ncbi:upf0052 domain containing protein [Niveomyces insectorum RCEF 264]|uniref:Upf0052 domain containing protein n=1 Tax=Niveomyces insectorum RCEF 264 TaxID=1081102 RepID=A0A162LCM9_9HYPO|nr:upf0052 domain containing protein [Niveomyces insectorum RCEF 264]
MDDGTGTPVRAATFLTTAESITASPVSTTPVRFPLADEEAEAGTGNGGDGTAPAANPSAHRGLCVFSGGTAANSLVDAFQAVNTHLSDSCWDVGDAGSTRTRPRRRQLCPLTYIIPISDNGGSSSELIRFFGGPSVGDIRSRLVRLIPTADDEDGATATTTNTRAALRALFEHRLCTADPHQARLEWLDLVEARHALWAPVPSATRELVRAVLNALNLEIVKRARPATSVFNFAGASVGNLFLTGARLFAGSFEAAICLLSLLGGIPDHVAVLPAINSNFTHHISAGLADGITTVAGQVNISHPSEPTALPDEGPALTADATASCSSPTATATTSAGTAGRPARTRTRARTAVDFDDATLPGSLPALRGPQQLAIAKDDAAAADDDLPARIARVWYINPYGHEIRPQANPKVLAALRQAAAIVYSIGSLYTSIVPSLILRGVGAAIAGDEDDEHNNNSSSRKCRHRRKVLILNSKLDRETGPRYGHGGDGPMTAVDFVKAVVGACKQSQADFGPVQDGECLRYVTHLVHLEETTTAAAAGTEVVAPAARPHVDADALHRLGIRCVPVPSQGSSSSSRKATERYDEAALTRALKGVLDGSWDHPEDL